MSSDTQAPDNRALWAAGNYDAIGELFWSVGEIVAGAVPIEPGMRVLDVGTGTGSAAIHAAQRDADVVGIDITPEMFDAARRHAADAGVQVQWDEGDAAALPYEDESFDRVLSAFGSIFATDSGAAADELVRVCRTGGEIVIAAWAIDGFGGRLSDTLRKYRAPSALSAVAPSQWGTVGHVRRTLGGRLVLAIEPHTLDLVFPSVDAMLAHFEEHLGALVVAREELEAGSYGALRGELRSLIEELDRGEGETRVAAGYLLITGHKPVAM